MQEEITTNDNNNGSDILSEYKKTAFTVGLYTAVCFALRAAAQVVINLMYDALHKSLSYDAMYISELSVSALFLQILPCVIGGFMFGKFGKNGTGIKSFYHVPKNNARAVANFPAVYGFGQALNIITIIVMFIFTNKADIANRINNVVNVEEATVASALFMFFMLVVIAPVFEEFMFRGLLMDALKPYGNGLAIFTTGILFGLFHGNFNQLFYTAAMGIALGYIANVTGSIVPTMIIHAIVNSIGGIILLFFSASGIQTYILNGADSEIPDSDMILIAAFGIFMVSLLIFIIVGIISAVAKIKQIRRYKVPKVCPEISNGKKVSMLILTVPSIIAVLLILNTFFHISDAVIAAVTGG